MLNCSKLTFVTANKAKNTEFYEKMYHFYYDPFEGAVFMRWRSEVVHLIFPPHMFSVGIFCGACNITGQLG